MGSSQRWTPSGRGWTAGRAQNQTTTGHRIRDNSHPHQAPELLLTCQAPDFCLPDLHMIPSMVVRLGLELGRFHLLLARANKLAASFRDLMGVFGPTFFPPSH